MKDRLAGLISEYNQIVASETINIRIVIKTEELRKSLLALQPELTGLERERNSFLEKLKAMPVISGDAVKTLSGLYWFIINVKNWQNAKTSLTALNAENETLFQQKELYLERCKDRFLEFSAETAMDSASCRRIVSTLERKESLRKTARESIRTNKLAITECNLRINLKTQRIRTIYVSLELGKHPASHGFAAILSVATLP
ncbi:MAG: hypothetical protein WCM93_15980, partial [Bacteroidota bacterium]